MLVGARQATASEGEAGNTNTHRGRIRSGRVAQGWCGTLWCGRALRGKAGENMTTTQQSFRSALRAEVRRRGTWSAARIARALRPQASERDILGLIEDAVEHERRSIVSDFEKSAFRALVKSKPFLPLPIDDTALDRFRALYDESFSLADGRDVKWGDATIEEHEQRIAMLESMQRGIAEAIGHHVQAISLIRAEGVERLRDIEQVRAI